jgi:hypothetical protein
MEMDFIIVVLLKQDYESELLKGINDINVAMYET